MDMVQRALYAFCMLNFNLMLVLEQILGPKLFPHILGGTKRRWMARLNARPPASNTKTVERIQNLSPELFREKYFDHSKPVIFSGAAKDWNCCRTWNLDHFSFRYGENDLLLVNAPGLTSRREGADYEFLTVRDLIGNIKSGGDKYLRFSPLLSENPSLVADLDLDWLGAMRGSKTFGNTYYMFMGGKGQRTLLHADQPCNLYVQVYGEKKWTLFMPEDSAYLYPQITNTAYVKSPVDVDAPDLERYPLFEKATPIEAHLKPGDVLYVPPHVWHHVVNLTDTIAVGYRFSSLKAAINSSAAFTVIRALSMNPPIWKTIQYGKWDTNLIWAHSGGKIKEVLKEREQRKKLKAAPEEAAHP